MYAMKWVAQSLGGLGYVGSMGDGGVYITRFVEDAKPFTLGERVPRGFRIARVAYRIVGLAGQGGSR